MKGWLVRRDGSIRGWIGDVYDTHAAAMADCPRGYEIVEVELPDPPHEWKVGDWGRHVITRNAIRIVDQVGTEFAMHGRLSSGSPFGEAIELHWLEENYTPCDPPAWFTEGGAS